MNNNIFTIEGEKCKFPFMFEMNKYNECTSNGSNQQWAFDKGANPGDKWCITESGEKQFCRKVGYFSQGPCPTPYNEKNLVSLIKKKKVKKDEQAQLKFGSGKTTQNNYNTDNILEKITTEEPSEIPVFQPKNNLGTGKSFNNNESIFNELSTEIPVEETVGEPNNIKHNKEENDSNFINNNTKEKIKVLTTNAYNTLDTKKNNDNLNTNTTEKNLKEVVYNFFNTNINYITNKPISKNLSGKELAWEYWDILKPFTKIFIILLIIGIMKDYLDCK